MNTAIEQIRAGVEAHLNGNLKAAESAYLAALTVDAANATAHNNLGFIYGQCQRWDEALLHLRTALDLKPDLSMAHSNLGQVLMNLGLAEEGKPISPVTVISPFGENCTPAVACSQGASCKESEPPP